MAVSRDNAPALSRLLPLGNAAKKGGLQEFNLLLSTSEPKDKSPCAAAFGAGSKMSDIMGTAAAERLLGTTGNDNTDGGGGGDRIYGGPGDDSLTGGDD